MLIRSDFLQPTERRGESTPSKFAPSGCGLWILVAERRSLTEIHRFSCAHRIRSLSLIIRLP